MTEGSEASSGWDNASNASGWDKDPAEGAEEAEQVGDFEASASEASDGGSGDDFDKSATAGAETPDTAFQASAFKPEPLHVRQLAMAQRRRAVKELARVDDQLRAVGNSGTPDEVEAANKRLRYRRRLLELRLRRLCELTSSHVELPRQMLEAAREGDAGYVAFCAEARVDVDVQDPRGQTPLIAATITNKLSVVKALLQFCADPRVQDANGATCAHYAVQLERMHALAAILDAPGGIPSDCLTIRDMRARTAVDYARTSSREQVLQLLRHRLGGPGGLFFQIVRGRCLDLVGAPRQLRGWRELWKCNSMRCCAAEQVAARDVA